MYNVQSVQHSVLQWSTGNTHHDIIESMTRVQSPELHQSMQKLYLSKYNLKVQYYRVQPAADYSHVDK